MALRPPGYFHRDETGCVRTVTELAVRIASPAVRRAAGGNPAAVEPPGAHCHKGKAARHRRGRIGELILNGDPAPAVCAAAGRDSAGTLGVDAQRDESEPARDEHWRSAPSSVGIHAPAVGVATGGEPAEEAIAWACVRERDSTRD